MSFLKINNKEIRSFKLYKQTNEIEIFLKNKKTNGLFMMCDSLNPSERMVLNNTLAENNLKINKITKNTIRFLFKNSPSLKNLLNGNLVLVKTRDGTQLTDNQILFLMKQEKLVVKFLYWNGTIYRETHIKNFVNSTQQEKTLQNIFDTIKKPITNLLYLIPLLKKTNYMDL